MKLLLPPIGVALAGIASAVVAFAPQLSTPRPAAATSVEIPPGPLTEDGFWRLVDHSAKVESDPDAQLADLRAGLKRLSPDQLLDFERRFDALMRRTYRWDLWGAAYIVNGGASDDGFEYFRCWLISKGRRAFETVAKQPDALADLLASGEPGGDLEFEDFAYVAREAWAAKTGRSPAAMPGAAAMAYGRGPSGEPFTEDPASLARRYPRLWARFGHR